MNTTAKQLSTPVLFLIFNRPDTTERVFEEIRKAKPKRLFIVADGPRNEEEREKCEAARAVVEKIDWDCEVKRNYSEKNLGCKIRVSSGIDWFFENVEQGIILEDDCLPSQSFFPFCEELLERYKDDERVGMISGNNFFAQDFNSKYSYHFSNHGSIWGWASWKRAWKNYDVAMKAWTKIDQDNMLYNYFYDKKVKNTWKDRFNNVFNGKIDTWDFQWAFTRYLNRYSTIRPCKNLVANIGFDNRATHTKGKVNPLFLVKHELDSALCHPTGFYINYLADKKLINQKKGNGNLLKKIKGFLRN